MIFRANDRVVGELIGGTYHTVRDTKKHFFRMYQGYGISRNILEAAKSFGCIKIDVEEHGANGASHLISDIETWFRKGRPYSYEDDEQLILPVKEMEIRG